MVDRKAELRDAALDYLVEHGAADLSLRPLARALGTSARMLIFHFGSKEELVQAALEALHQRLRASFMASCRKATPGNERPPIKRFWQWAKRAENARLLRLVYEVQVIAAQNPAQFGRYMQAESAAWHAAALDAMSGPGRSPVMATLSIAVFDGLFLELMTTGRVRRLDSALDRFIELATRRD